MTSPTALTAASPSAIAAVLVIMKLGLNATKFVGSVFVLLSVFGSEVIEVILTLLSKSWVGLTVGAVFLT